MNHSSPSRDLQTFPCSPYSPRGLLRRYTDKKCIINLKRLRITLLLGVIYKLFRVLPTALVGYYTGTLIKSVSYT